MTKLIDNPYHAIDDYVPRSTVRRSFTPDAVMSSAAEAATGLLAAREARQSGIDQFDGSTTDAEHAPERAGTTYAHPDNPVTQKPESQRSATSLADTIGRISGPTSSDPRGVTPEDIRNTPVPIASQARDDYARPRPRPLPAPIFRPQPEVGGRPNGVPDHVALDAIRRAAAANDESAFDDVARLAWQREASINGNPSGDTSAPRAYIESWKGQMRAGEDAGPYGNMLLQAAPQGRAASSMADQQRIAAERAALSTAPSAVATAQSRLAPLTQSQGRPTAGEPGVPPLANGPVLASPPQTQAMPDRGAPVAQQSLPDRGAPAAQQNYSLVDQVLAPKTAAPAAALPPKMDTSSRDNNLRQWAPALRAVEQKTGLRADILASIIQAENGGGQSPLSANDNNYFSISHVGRPKQAGPGSGGRFARYDTPQDSLDDFVDLVSTSPRYAEAWANRGDPDKFFEGLVKGGYIVPEPGFPVETWMRNLKAGRDTFNQVAPAATPKTDQGNTASQAQPPATEVAATTAPSVQAAATSTTRMSQTSNFSLVDEIMASRGRPSSAATAGGGFNLGDIENRYKGGAYVYGGGRDGQGGVPGSKDSDCSAFVSAVWREKGVALPAHTDTAYLALQKIGAPVIPEQEARPGDIVFYMGAGTGGAITHHVGIYAGPGKVLDQSVSNGGGVQTRPLKHGGDYVIMRDPRVKN